MRVIAAIYEAAKGGGTVRLPEVKGLDTTRGRGRRWGDVATDRLKRQHC